MSRRAVDYQLRPDRDLTILIPARAGSKRCPGKNTRMLGGKPLIQWTIEAAKAADAACIIVSSDDPLALKIADDLYCAWHEREPEHATDLAPDFQWVQGVSRYVKTPYFAICRPTSPFRTASTIRRGFACLVGSHADSIRALSRVASPHPAKMWRIERGLLRPVLGGSHPDGTPYHSSPTQSLPEVYVQNASLEMARTSVIEATKTISGYRIAPFLTDGLEGFDINTEDDFLKADSLMSEEMQRQALELGYGHGV